MGNGQIYCWDQVTKSNCNRIITVDYNLIPHERRCYKCKEYFPATMDFFYSNKSKHFGLDSVCKICQGDISREKARKKYKFKTKYKRKQNG